VLKGPSPKTKSRQARGSRRKVASPLRWKDRRRKEREGFFEWQVEPVGQTPQQLKGSGGTRKLFNRIKAQKKKKFL